MKLDSRLALCADMVTGDIVCDVGTDHGLLPAFLLTSGRCRKAVCSDINPAPLAAARETLSGEGVMDRAETYLSDGLDCVPLEGVTDIVIAGMGGETIAKIMSCPKAGGEFSFVLQPMSRAEYLREFLWESGFEVTMEKGAVSGGFAYTVMKCRYTGRSRKISPEERITGLLSKTLPDDREYVKRQLIRMDKEISGLMKSGNSPGQAEKKLRLLKKLKEEWKL